MSTQRVGVREIPTILPVQYKDTNVRQSCEQRKTKAQHRWLRSLSLWFLQYSMHTACGVHQFNIPCLLLVRRYEVVHLLPSVPHTTLQQARPTQPRTVDRNVEQGRNLELYSRDVRRGLPELLDAQSLALLVVLEYCGWGTTDALVVQAEQAPKSPPGCERITQSCGSMSSPAQGVREEHRRYRTRIQP